MNEVLLKKALDFARRLHAGEEIYGTGIRENGDIQENQRLDSVAFYSNIHDNSVQFVTTNYFCVDFDENVVLTKKYKFLGLFERLAAGEIIRGEFWISGGNKVTSLLHAVSPGCALPYISRNLFEYGNFKEIKEDGDKNNE